MRRAAARQVGTQAVLLLVGGPAGAGKSTVAVAWCRTRQRAVRIDLASGYDVALETVFEPEDFAQRWRPLLTSVGGTHPGDHQQPTERT